MVGASRFSGLNDDLLMITEAILLPVIDKKPFYNMCSSPVIFNAKVDVIQERCQLYSSIIVTDKKCSFAAVVIKRKG